MQNLIICRMIPVSVGIIEQKMEFREKNLIFHPFFIHKHIVLLVRIRSITCVKSKTGSPSLSHPGVPPSPSVNPSKLTSFDKELNSEPNTTIFRLNTGYRANPDKKYNVFMYEKWVKNQVFRPKLYFLLDDTHRNWYHSTENQILHLTQATRKLTQIMERIRTRKTRIWC